MNQSREAESSTSYRPLWKAAVGALVLLLVVAGVKSYRDLSIARTHEHKLRQDIESTHQRIRILSDRIERIENDDATLEQLAREELGWVKANDVVIVLPDEDSGGDPTP